MGFLTCLVVGTGCQLGHLGSVWVISKDAGQVSLHDSLNQCPREQKPKLQAFVRPRFRAGSVPLVLFRWSKLALGTDQGKGGKMPSLLNERNSQIPLPRTLEDIAIAIFERALPQAVSFNR